MTSTNALVFGRRRIAAALGVCPTTLKEWERNPLSPVSKYLSRVGSGRGRIASSERLLAQLRDELAGADLSRRTL